MSRYFVTGATGFLGGEVVKQLIGRGHQVAALVRSADKASFLKILGVDVHVGDITDRDTLRAPMENADGVFHVAAWYKIGVRREDSSSAERVNVDGTRNVLETARDLGIARVVYTSTVGVFGDTHGKLVDENHYARGPFLTEYDRTKWMAHYEVALPMARAGLPLVIAMPGTVYGPGDTSGIHATLVQLLRGRLHTTPRGVQFCWGYIADVARGLQQAMDNGRIGEFVPAHRSGARVRGGLRSRRTARTQAHAVLSPASLADAGSGVARGSPRALGYARSRSGGNVAADGGHELDRIERES